MKIESHEYEIIGIGALLTNNPATMGLNFTAPPGETLDDREKRYTEEARLSAYVKPDGTFYLPVVAFRGALLSGAKGKRFGKVSAPSLVAATVFSAEPRQPVLCDPKTWQPLKSHDKLVTSCVLKATKGRVIKSRALFPVWGTRITFDVMVDRCDPKNIVELFLNEGGITAGVGAWRIEKKGEYGRFSAKMIS